MDCRLLILALATAGGCTSPESVREQGGGPGADTGNRGEIVSMHEGADPYFNTPRQIPAEAPALQSARHADRLSR